MFSRISVLIALIAFVVSSCSGSKNERDTAVKKIPVIFDTDANNELDDQHALAYLLMNGDVFDVLGVTVNKTFGGGDVSQHYAEAERVMRLCDRFPGIPLRKGANANCHEILPALDSSVFDGSDAVNFIIAQAKHFSAGNKLVLIMVGKLTNAALAFKKDPSVIPLVKIVWLGSNYPDPGEYNMDNDTVAMNEVLKTSVEFEMVTVRYGLPSGTDAVKVTPEDIKLNMPDKGPHVKDSVMGRHNKAFTCFGDYSVNLFEHAQMYGNPPSRALFDMAAVAIVKNPGWAKDTVISCPVFSFGKWVEQPGNNRQIKLWEHFDRAGIVDDFFRTMDTYRLVDPKPASE